MTNDRAVNGWVCHDTPTCVQTHLPAYRHTYLRTDTVRASEELAHGQMASGFKPLFWKALRNESQEVKDPKGNR